MTSDLSATGSAAHQQWKSDRIKRLCESTKNVCISLQSVVNYGLTNKSAETAVTAWIEAKANEFLKT
jgi:hypothetical protein